MRLTTPRRLTIAAALATVGALVGAALVAAPAAAAPPYIVTNNTSAGQGSLPQEVQDAITDGGGTITFDMNTVTNPINLTAAIPTIPDNVDIVITRPRDQRAHREHLQRRPRAPGHGRRRFLELNDISFDSTFAGTDGVLATEADLDFENVSVSGYGNIGVSVVDGQFNATDSFFSNNGTGGVRWQGTNDADLEGIDFTDVTVNNNGAGGILTTPGLGAGNFDFVRVNAQLNNGWALDIQGGSSHGQLFFDGGEYQQNNSGISINVPSAEFITWQDVHVHDNEGQGVNIDVANTDITFAGVRSNGNGSLSPVAGGGLRLALDDAIFQAYNSSFSNNTAAGRGGGVLIDSVESDDITSSVLFQNCFIDDNNANGENSTGGGVAIETVNGSNENEAFFYFWTTSISANLADGNGGGLWADDLGSGVNYNGQLSFYQATIDDNESTSGDGGGIAVDAFANNITPDEFPFIVIDSTTISNNRAPIGEGGGLFLDKNGASLPDLTPVFIENSTFSGNTADSGAAATIDTGDDNVTYVHLDIDVTTITDNQSGLMLDPDLEFALTNSIVSQNEEIDIDLDDINPDAFTIDYSNIGVVNGLLLPIVQAGAGNQLGINPQLGPLAENGGPTLTHLPLAGSPVFNAGNPAYPAFPSQDQRGEPRILQGRVDMGSVESPAPLPATGGELNPLWAIGALLLLLAGAALVVMRRRAA